MYTKGSLNSLKNNYNKDSGLGISLYCTAYILSHLNKSHLFFKVHKDKFKVHFDCYLNETSALLPMDCDVENNFVLSLPYFSTGDHLISVITLAAINNFVEKVGICNTISFPMLFSLWFWSVIQYLMLECCIFCLFVCLWVFSIIVLLSKLRIWFEDKIFWWWSDLSGLWPLLSLPRFIFSNDVNKHPAWCSSLLLQPESKLAIKTEALKLNRVHTD